MMMGLEDMDFAGADSECGVVGWEDAKEKTDKMFFTNIFKEIVVTQLEGMKINICFTISRYKHRAS
jgi:hypothetical protein